MTLDVILCDRDLPCERCGVFVWWDDTPHPTCHACAAIVPENCGTCAHSNDEQSLLPSLNTYCTLRYGFYQAKLMEKTSRCRRFEAKS